MCKITFVAVCSLVQGLPPVTKVMVHIKKLRHLTHAHKNTHPTVPPFPLRGSSQKDDVP